MSNINPLISICIPAYKRIDFLKRLLHSISIQTFLDFEVVVTDDSASPEVAKLCDEYGKLFLLRYYKNEKPFGTPENWNEAIRKANGSWIKIMHDDDWFPDEDSLEEYVEAIYDYPDEKFFYSAYRNMYAKSGRFKEVFTSIIRRAKLQKNPAILFASNVIGPPSVILHKNDKEFWYDPAIKWVVDIDFYIRVLQKYRAIYIPSVLVNVGMHDEQVTVTTFRKPEVEIPENFYLLDKVGSSKLMNVSVYDAWWRLMRNLNIQNLEQIQRYGYQGRVPMAIQSMIRWQQRIPRSVLRIGVLSKLLMLLNYLRNISRIR